MMIRARLILAVLSPGAMLAQVGLFAAAGGSSPGRLSFNEHIQPILSEHCYACHGPDPGSRKAELRLDRADQAFGPRKEGGPVIVPRDPGASALIKRIEAADPKQVMPPPDAHKPLKPEQIALLRQWVTEGAEYQDHWAFIPPSRPALPRGSAPRDWDKNPIDRFILARMQREGLSPSPEADRRTLLRRVTLDLTGLPPTPEEVDAFVADKSAGAYERVVDRLLASARFGEHRARYWLDYVRFADTHGIHLDNYRAIWPYRDYVIRAINENMPFDRFLREQLAGDLVPTRSIDSLTATGLVRSNLTTSEGGTVFEEVYVALTRDRVEAFGTTFLGLTTGCAACHDHKFDPITQKDFYGLAAFLGNTLEKPWDRNIAEPDPVLRLPPAANRPAADAVLARRAELQAQLDARRSRARELVGNWLAAGNRPQPVAPDQLELRLRLDEGRGDILHNSAPGAAAKSFKATVNPVLWGENSWLWPSMRMDIFTRINLGDLGDVEANEKFSAGGWLMLRPRAGGGANAGTGNGTLLSRMGDGTRKGGAGWDLSQENSQFVVNLVAQSGGGDAAADEDGTDDTRVVVPAKKAKGKAAPPPPTAARRAIRVATRDTFVRDQWYHVFFTYDGSGKAAGVKLYVNGKVVSTNVILDSLGAADSIRTDAAMHLGRRDDFRPMRETRFQDVRIYRHALSAAEMARMPFEDVAAEIVQRQPDPARWSTDEAFVVADRFFLSTVDREAMELTAAIEAHEAAFETLAKGGIATLIALEKPTPAYADVLKRGDYHARVERLGPATPHFLPPLPAGAPLNRLGLAEWLVSPEHPLLARVTVNRAWQELFGRGLVETADDFGIMGARPSHPGLLDWLAVEFRESGWDVKRLYRTLVTSATYRQTATTAPAVLAKDPANRWLSRGPRFRMDAEMLRDGALAASGLLVEKIGGPSVRPYHPAGLWEAVAMPNSNTSKYVADRGEALYRRSVYTFWKRASPPAAMEIFDATSREVACVRRARTNTPLQALVTMNDPQWIEAARKLAERAVKAAAAPDARLDFLARTTLSRPLSAEEKRDLAETAEPIRRHFRGEPAAARSLLAVGESPTDASLEPAELAEWTIVASQFLNLDEFLTK